MLFRVGADKTNIEVIIKVQGYVVHFLLEIH